MDFQHNPSRAELSRLLVTAEASIDPHRLVTPDRAFASPGGRHPTESGHHTAGRATRLLVDVLHRPIGQAGLLRHGLGNAAIEKRHTEPLGDARTDHAAAGGP